MIRYVLSLITVLVLMPGNLWGQGVGRNYSTGNNECTITTPLDWHENLEEKKTDGYVRVQSKNNEVDLYLYFVTKEDLVEQSFQKYAQGRHTSTAKVREKAVVSELRPITIGSYKALQGEVQFTYDGGKWITLHTYIDGGAIIADISVTASPSMLRLKRSEVDKVLQSFQVK